MKNATEVSLFEGLFLLVQTPRGGEFNHRFLAPPDVDEQFINYAIDHLADCALVAQRPQAQTSSGRMGQEWIALVGVDKAQMTALEQQNIQRLLDDLLQNELDELIRQTDWETQHKAITLRFSELTKWRTRFEDRVSSKPLKITNKELIMSNAKREKKQMIETLLWPSVAGLIVIAAAAFTILPGTISSPQKETTTYQLDYTSFCSHVVSSGGCKGEELREAFYKFHKILRDSQGIIQGLQKTHKENKKKIEGLIGKWNGAKGFSSKEIKENDDFTAKLNKLVEFISLCQGGDPLVSDLDKIKKVFPGLVDQLRVSQVKKKLEEEKSQYENKLTEFKEAQESFKKLVADIKDQDIKVELTNGEINEDEKKIVRDRLDSKIEKLNKYLLSYVLQNIEKGNFTELSYKKIATPESKDQDYPTNQRGSKQDAVTKIYIYDIEPKAQEDDKRAIDEIRAVFATGNSTKKSLPDLIPQIDFPELKELEEARKALVKAAE
jgi:hypothetical protein